MTDSNSYTQPLTISITEFVAQTGLSRTRVFEELKLGRLRALKCGRRTLIPASEVLVWLEGLEERKVG